MTQFESFNIIWNKKDQCSCNNVVVASIPYSVRKRELKLFGKIDIEIHESDIEACHRLGKSCKTIIHFVNRKFWSKILAKKSELSDLKQERLAEIGLPETVKLLVWLNLSPRPVNKWHAIALTCAHTRQCLFRHAIVAHAKLYTTS